MNDEIKKALATARVNSLSDALGGRSIAEAALSDINSRDTLFARIAQISAAPSALSSIAAHAQQFSAVDAQLRKLSEQISARSREPQVVEFMTNIDRMSSIAAAHQEDSSIAKLFAASQRQADSSIAKPFSTAQAEISGSARLMATIGRFRESFVAKATIPLSLTRALDEMDLSSRGALSMADFSISSFAAMHEASARSISRIAAEVRAFDTQAMERLTKSFESAGKLALTRELPASFASAFAEASAGAKYLDSIRLPLIDSASAAAIARVWGEEGVDRQLRALGIEVAKPTSPAATPEATKLGKRIEVLPILRDAVALFSLLFALYQWWDSQQMEARIIGAVREDQAQREKQMEAVKALISEALARQEARDQMRFICLARVAVIRSAPRAGSSRTGSAFPNQVVKPVSEAGKWIQIEYYDFLAQETRIGWALKKYFTRIRPPISAQ